MLISPAPLPRFTNERVSLLNTMSPPFETRVPKSKSPVALKIMSPPLVDRVVLDAKMMSPFVTVKVAEFPLPCCRLILLVLLNLIRLLAKSWMLVVLERPSRVPTEIVAVTAPLAVAPVPSSTKILSGSRRRVPVFPFAAVVSTDPSKYNSSFPETSTNPPSPKYWPPRPLTMP